MIDKETASYIWRCICNYAGDYSEDRGEWCYDLNIDPEDCDEFERFIADKIEEL